MKTTLYIIILLTAVYSKAQTPCGDTIGGWKFEQGNTRLILNFVDSTLTDSVTSAKKCKSILRAIGTNTEIDGNTGYADVALFKFKLGQCDIKLFTATELMLSEYSFKVKINFSQYKYEVVIYNIVAKSKNVPNGISFDNDIFNKNGCVKYFEQHHFERYECQFNTMIQQASKK